ncbi:MAG: putative ABC transporter permease [Bifidobacterium breve]|nr:putative ABC transporter permease [Bifidobacterium breve]
MIIALEHYFLWFLFYSFVGWVYESILVSCQERRLVNRGFLNGPLCPIYGTGAVLGIAVLGNLHNPIIIFLISQPYVAQFTDLIPVPMLHTLVTVLALVTIIDLAVTVAGMLGFEQVLDSVAQAVQDVAARAGGTWQWGADAVSDKMRELSQDTLERLRWVISGVVNAQQKRMLKSFPKFQMPGRQNIIDSLRELMGPRK